MNKLKNYWNSLDTEIVVNNKIMVLEIICVLLLGILLGLMFAPIRSFTIASNNENNGNGNSASNEEAKED